MTNDSRNTAISVLPGLAQFMEISADYLLGQRQPTYGETDAFDLFGMSGLGDSCAADRIQAGEHS